MAFFCFDVSIRVMNMWRAVLSSLHFCRSLAMTSSALFSWVSRPSSAAVTINWSYVPILCNNLIKRLTSSANFTCSRFKAS